MSIPLFSDFNKSASDLFSKKFAKEAGFELTSKRVAGDATIESNVSITNKAKDATNSSFKLTQKFPQFGECEIDASVNGKAKVTGKFSKLVDNLTVKVSANSDKLDKDVLADFRSADQKVDYAKKPFAVLQADYETKTLNGSLSVNTNGNGAFVDASGAFGFKDLALGANAKVAISKKDGEADVNPLLDYGAGVRYNANGVTFGASLLKKGTSVELSHFQPIAKDYSVASKFEWTGLSSLWSGAAGRGLLSLGYSYKLANGPLVKTKAAVGKSSKGENQFTVTNYGEWLLLNDSLKLGATVEHNALKSSIAPEWYGVSFALGE